MFLVNDCDQWCPLAWGSNKTRRVVKSTPAAETLALVDARQVCFCLGHILSEILFRNVHKIPIECYVDNHSVWDNVHCTKNVTEKRLRIDLVCIKEMLVKQELSSVKWVDSSNQLSHCFTKRCVNTGKLLEVLRNGCLAIQGNK